MKTAKTTSKANARKPTPSTKPPPHARFPNYVIRPNDFNAILLKYTNTPPGPGVFDIINEFLRCLCQKVAQVNKPIDIVSFNRQLRTSQDPEREPIFLENGAIDLIYSLARGKQTTNYYDPDVSTIFQTQYNAKLDPYMDNVTAHYIGNNLQRLCDYFIKLTQDYLEVYELQLDKKTKQLETNWTLTKKDLIAAFIRDTFILQLAKHIGFNIKKYDEMKKLPATTKRLPNVWNVPETKTMHIEPWKIDLENPDIRKQVNAFRDRWLPGDIVQLETEDRSNCVYIITESNKPTHLPFTEDELWSYAPNASCHIPEWAVQRAINNGFNLNEILEAYAYSRAYFVELPTNLKVIKDRTKGTVYNFKALYMYDNTYDSDENCDKIIYIDPKSKENHDRRDIEVNVPTTPLPDSSDKYWPPCFEV